MEIYLSEQKEVASIPAKLDGVVFNNMEKSPEKLEGQAMSRSINERRYVWCYGD